MLRLAATVAFVFLSLPLFAVCPDAPTFTQRSIPASGIDPFVGFIEDVNGDGIGDLVVFYNTSAGFQVFLGSPTGVLVPTSVQFGEPTHFDNFSSMTAADLNNDNQIDLIGSAGGEVRTFYGNGAGTFTAGPVLNTAGCGSIALATADFDSDSRIDVAALTACGHLYVFLQTSPGSFASPTDMTFPLMMNLAAGMLDADLHPDLVVTTEDSKVIALFGHGDGQFSSSTIDLGPDGPFEFAQSVATQDFDSDGTADLAVAIVNRGVQILFNNGDRTFASGPLLPALGGNVLVADFNYDDIPDVFASGYGGFHIFLSNGDGTFGASQFTPIPEFSPGTSSARRDFYVVGDLRGLLRVDVATTYRVTETIIVALTDCGPPPVLTSVDPVSGPISGGNTVELHGENFVPPVEVLFGSTPATVVSTTPTLLTVIAPAHPAGVVSVSVTTPNGTATLDDAYTFVAPTALTIQVAEILPASRPFEITALLTPPITGGTVSFFIDDILAGTANVTSGVATIQAIAPATLGPHTIRAEFSGAPGYEPSSATAIVAVAADIPLLSPTALAGLLLALALCGAAFLRN